MSKQGKRRVACYLNAHSMYLLGVEQSARAVAAIVDEYAKLVESAGVSLAARLTPADWAFLVEVFDASLGAIARGYGHADESFAEACRAAVARDDFQGAVEEAGGRERVLRLVDLVRGLNVVETKALILALKYGLRMLRTEEAPVNWWTPWARIAWQAGDDLTAVEE